MAAIVHGCGSPRQHQGGGGGASVLSSTRAHQQQQHSHLPHQTSAPMYASMPKYTRSSSQPTATPNHSHHIYSGSNSSGTGQYKKQSMLPPSMSYLPKSPAAQPPSQFVHSQRPFSASATAVDSCRSYIAHPSAATMIYRSARHSNRKSAVELLAESKPFYVKSETVMERLQQQSANYRSNSSTIGCGSKRGRNSLDSATSDRFNVSSYSGVSTSSCLQADMERSFVTASPMHHGGDNGSRSQHMHHHHHHGHIGRRGTGSTNNLLQSKLRKLLSTEAANKDLCNSRSKERYREELPIQFDFSSNKTLSGSCIQELSLGNQTDPALIIPQSFLSPQSLPLQSDAFDDIYNYGIDNSSTEGGPLVLTDDYRAISPPAEYAADTSQAHNEQRSRYNYQRSYSHSHEVAAEDPKYATANAYNINSHKSLPDLHSQISRHSPHSEILSCCSRGNRSIKSTGESSLNRDSGGSSGHYTHRSEPCYKQQRGGECERDVVPTGAYDTKIICTSNCSDYRRDSGSSTQHSANSYCGYASPSYRNIDCAECRCRNNSIQMESADYLLNFTTPEVPEAFQDDYSPPSPTVNKYAVHMEEQRFSNQQKHLQQHNVQTYQQQQRVAKHMQNQMLQSPGSAPSVEDLSPPPIQFKRQKCIRFKNRQRVSISNAANEAVVGGGGGGGEVYVRNSDRPTFFFPKSIVSNTDHQQQQLQAHHYKREQQTSRRNSQQSIELPSTPRDADIVGVSDLERFFDRLGLNDDKFHEIYSPPKRRHSAETDSDESSTVFFSDVSTVDSMRLPDSTETQPQTTQTYRPSEPPSIVERNARIIKWLCNCRKLQYT